LVTVVTHEWVYFPVASQTQAVMVRSWKPQEPLPAKTTALLYGPGMGVPDQPELIKQEVQRNWMKLPVPVVVDASALDWVPPGSETPPGLRVITPHPGEAARLLGLSADEIQDDRVGALRQLSNRLGHCWVVLKGSHTLVGRSTGPILVNSSGNALLGQGGSGDLLSGFITGLLAQPGLQSDPAKVLSFAVWAHGEAADALSASRPNWIIEDQAAQLGLRPGS
jgi:NAD(P)H-hydrate epimerase